MKKFWKYVGYCTLVIGAIAGIKTILETQQQSANYSQLMENSPNSTQNQFTGPIIVNSNTPKIMFQETISSDVPNGEMFKQTFRILTTQTTKPISISLVKPKLVVSSAKIEETSLSMVAGAQNISNGTYQTYIFSFLTKERIGEQSFTFSIQ